MRFRLLAPAFINLPTVVEDGAHRYEKSLHTRITHPDGRPITAGDTLDMDFPSSLTVDSVSRTWEPLDDEAKALQAKLIKGAPVAPPAGAVAPVAPPVKK